MLTNDGITSLMKTSGSGEKSNQEKRNLSPNALETPTCPYFGSSDNKAPQKICNMIPSKSKKIH